MKEPEAESDTHASFESGFRNNSIVQNNNYRFFFNNYQNTPSFLAPLYTFCVFWTSTIVVVFIQHLENPERRSVVSPHVAWPPLLVTSDPPSSATRSNVLHLCLITWLSHVVQALQGQQVFSWVTRTYMERHVCYTISYSKLACGIEKGGGEKWGLVVPKTSQLDFLCWPHQVLFFFCSFSFLFSQGSRRAQLQTQTSGSGPQSQSTWHRWLEPDRFWEY